jgi:hypothetical protein
MQWRAFILKTGPPKQFFEKVNAGAVVHLVGNTVSPIQFFPCVLCLIRK